MTVLVITSMDDVHADHTIPKIEGGKNGCEVVRLNTDNFVDNVEIEITCPSRTNPQSIEGRVYFKDSGRKLCLSDVSSVWYRKPGPMRVPKELSHEPIRQFVCDENKAVYQSVLALLETRFWVSNYRSIQQASHKLANLAVAAQLGLNVPLTLVTKDPNKAREFAERHAWNIIAKPFALTTFKMPNNPAQSWDTFAKKIGADEFDALASNISIAPVMLQSYVDKKVELRVTIVGKKVFCTAIDSQAHAFAAEDWRAVDVEELHHREAKLPSHIEDQLLKFNQHYNLQFSTFDIIETPNGNYTWLECNPNGQWLWIEHLTGQPIAESIAELLKSP